MPASIAGMQINSLNPRLVVHDPDDAIDFYRRALDAEMEDRHEHDGVVVHAALKVADCAFSISAEVPDWGWLAPTSLGGSAVLLALDVDDARAVGVRMVSEGAEVVVPIEDRPYGQCEGRIRDPFGHLWIPSHRIPTATANDPVQRPEVGVRRIVADLTVADTTSSAEFYGRLLDLDLTMNLGWVATLTSARRPSRQLTLMTSDATASRNPHLSVEVDDLDLVWHRAQAMDAAIVHERTVEPWGVERFFVSDPSGNVVNVLAHVDESTAAT